MQRSFHFQLFSFHNTRHQTDWPPPPEDNNMLENTPCLGSGRQGLIQRFKSGGGAGGRVLQLHRKQPLNVKAHKQKQPFYSLFRVLVITTTMSSKEAICLNTATLCLKHTYFIHLVVTIARQRENALFHILWKMFTNKWQQNFHFSLSCTLHLSDSSGEQLL